MYVCMYVKLFLVPPPYSYNYTHTHMYVVG